MRAMMRTRAFSSSSSEDGDDEQDYRRDKSAHMPSMHPTDTPPAATHRECAKCASLSKEIDSALSWGKGLERERSELQSRVADLEREKAETASQVEELQHMARQRDLACDDSLRAGQDMAHDLDATLGLRARRFRASEAGLEEDSGIPRAAGKALSMADCAGTWAMQGWTKALDAASGKAYFCPVKVMATGEPVWEIPNGGLVICCMPAVEMRRDEENIVRSTFMRKLVGAMIVVQFSVALCGAAFFEYNFGMLSKMIHALWPRW